jgi:hypothetical protein
MVPGVTEFLRRCKVRHKVREADQGALVRNERIPLRLTYTYTVSTATPSRAEQRPLPPIHTRP